MGLTLVAEWVRVPVVSKPEASLAMICVRCLDRLSLPGRDGMSCHSGGVPPPCCCDRYHHHHLLHHHVRNCHLGGRQEAEWYGGGGVEVPPRPSVNSSPPAPRNPHTLGL